MSGNWWMPQQPASTESIFRESAPTRRGVTAGRGGRSRPSTGTARRPGLPPLPKSGELAGPPRGWGRGVEATAAGLDRTALPHSNPPGLPAQTDRLTPGAATWCPDPECWSPPPRHQGSPARLLPLRAAWPHPCQLHCSRRSQHLAVPTGAPPISGGGGGGPRTNGRRGGGSPFQAASG
jgi:hypothetical protein